MEIPHFEFASSRPDTRLPPNNSYRDLDYFIAAFPSLFPRGSGGYLHRERREKVSLERWAKWTLKHHSRRFAKHPTFIFLLYDVIFLRQTSLGNHLQVKKGYWDSVKEDFSSLSSEQLKKAAADIQKDDVSGYVLRSALHVIIATHCT
jgi:hypothetical protein